MNRYVCLYSGARVALNEQQHVPIIDVMLSLCRTPMFAGATRLFYTVGLHCLSASEITNDPLVALHVLLHEAEVAVYGDVPGPVKVPEQKTVEKATRRRMLEGWGVPYPSVATWEQVEHFDKLEQAACVRICGFPETVHEAVWSEASEWERKLALQAVARNLNKYPPCNQMYYNSLLHAALVYKFEELAQR